MRLNKTLVKKIVDDAIAGKFLSDFRNQIAKLTTDATLFAVSNSQHEKFMQLGLEHEMMLQVCCVNKVEFKSPIKPDNTVSFIQYRISQVSLDHPVFGVGYVSVIDEDLPSLADLRKLVESIQVERAALHNVVAAYSTTEKLQADLPWIAKYIPEKPNNSTQLVSINAIEEINKKFGG
jgi:hypothetical protein